MKDIKVIKIDGNKLLGAKSKEDVEKMIREQITSQLNKEELRDLCNSDILDEILECKNNKKEESAREGSLKDVSKLLSFMSDMNGLSEEKECFNNDECECDLCDKEDPYLAQSKAVQDTIKEMKKNSSNKDGVTFHDMIADFESGFCGDYTNGTDTICFREGTLLYKTSYGITPVTLTVALLMGSYKRMSICIAPSDALMYATSGDSPRFEIDLYGRPYKGTLTMKKGVPSYKIEGEIIGNAETIILTALMSGKWYL